MSGHKGLDKWFKQDWVDIGSKKKGGGFAKCKRSKAQGVGGKPTNVATFKKRKKAADGGYMGSFIDVQIPEGKGTSRRIGNPSVRNYYKSLGII
mgnify:CR=1 FL=1